MNTTVFIVNRERSIRVILVRLATLNPVCGRMALGTGDRSRNPRIGHCSLYNIFQPTTILWFSILSTKTAFVYPIFFCFSYFFFLLKSNGSFCFETIEARSYLGRKWFFFLLLLYFVFHYKIYCFFVGDSVNVYVYVRRTIRLYPPRGYELFRSPRIGSVAPNT